MLARRRPATRWCLVVAWSLAVAAMAGCVAANEGEDPTEGRGGSEDAGSSSGRGSGGGDPSDGGRDAGAGDAFEGSGADAGIVNPCDPRTCDEVAETDGLYADTDGDGLLDCEEGAGDPDEDGIPNCADPDSNGNGVADGVDGDGDGDGDGIPDYLDMDSDSDGDGIQDSVEGTEDADEDGIPNYLDEDADGDTWNDAIEYGRDPNSGLPPIDSDGDRTPDYLDLDSDADGLLDADELGCPLYTDRLDPDSDDDGYSDLLEIAFGSDACDPTSDIREFVDFYFELPYNGEPQADVLEFGTDVRQGDVLFQMDTTGSMSDEVRTLRSTLSSQIIPDLRTRLPDIGFAVSQFDDFPCNSHGGGADVPFSLLQRVTIDSTAAQSAVNRLPDHSGGDGPESGIEALYQAATGAGTNDCRSGLVRPFDPAVGANSFAYGEIGGAGFRDGSMPIIVHITDAVTHARGESGYSYGHTRDETYPALSAIGARVIGVASGSSARNDLEQISNATGSTVPVCAFEGACGANTCCTGASGGGRAPDADGNCTLVYDINGNGSGLDTSIINGIEALVRFAPLDVTTRVRPDPDELAETGIDTSLFITGVRAEAVDPAENACLTAPTMHDFDGDGINDGFLDVAPGSTLYFAVEAQNTTVLPTDRPQSFVAFIDVVSGGAAVLDTRIVSILVPPDIKQ